MKMSAFYKRFEKVPVPTRYFTILLVTSSLLCLPFMLIDLIDGSGPVFHIWVYLLVLNTPFMGVLYGFSKDKGFQNYTPSQKFSGIFMAAGILLISPILSIGIALDRPVVGWMVVIPFVMLFLGYKYGDSVGKKLLEKDNNRG